MGYKQINNFNCVFWKYSPWQQAVLHNFNEIEDEYAVSIGDTQEYDGVIATLNRVMESALYVTLFIDCASIGHPGDDYAFVLSDELGNDYTAYPNGDNDADGYWFVKPEAMGTQLTLKVIRSGLVSDPQGNVTDDSYEVLYEIPIELK